jgi:hypothetical protein
VFDKEPIGRQETTQLFFETVRTRSDTLYISDLVLEEINRAPDRVRFSPITLIDKFGRSCFPNLTRVSHWRTSMSPHA